MSRDLVEVSLEWGVRPIKNVVSTLQIARGRSLFVGEAADCGLAVPGIERHPLLTWDAESPVVTVPPGGRMGVARTILGQGRAHRMRPDEQIEVRVGQLVLRVTWLSKELAAHARTRARVDARPIVWSVLGHAVALAALGIAVGRRAPAETSSAPEPTRTAWHVGAERPIEEAAADATATSASAEMPAGTAIATAPATATTAAATTSAATARVAHDVRVREVETFGMISILRVPKKADVWPSPREGAMPPSIHDAVPLGLGAPDDRWSDDYGPWANQ